MLKTLKHNFFCFSRFFFSRKLNKSQMTEYIDIALSDLVFIFSHFSMTEYLSPERALSVRVSVYVCVCVCIYVSVRVSNSYNFRPIFMKLGPHDHSKNLK